MPLDAAWLAAAEMPTTEEADPSVSMVCCGMMSLAAKPATSWP